MSRFLPSVDQTHIAQMSRRACNGKRCLLCCLEAQKKTVRSFSQGLLGIVGMFTERAANRSSDAQKVFWGDQTEKISVPTSALVVTASVTRAVMVPAAVPASTVVVGPLLAPIIVLPSFAALANAYGALVFTSVVNDFSTAILGFQQATETELETQTQEALGVRTRTRTRKKIFDCDKCVKSSLFKHPLGPPNGTNAKPAQ